jgi:hypothetical protein
MLARMLKDRGVAVIEDVRASKRDNYAPAQITTSYVSGPLNELIDNAVSVSPSPVALVTDTGRVFVLSSGGSGEILVAGEPTSEQDDAVLAVMEVLHDVWGVKQPAPKKSKRKEVVEEITPEEIAESLESFVEVLDAIQTYEETS